jgi:predicted porin
MERQVVVGPMRRGRSCILAAAVFVLASDMDLQRAIAADLGGNCCADLEQRVAELEATTVRKGNRRVSLTVSGHVSRELMYWDDHVQSDLYSVDNGLSTSRFRFTGTATINPEWSVGFMLEMDLRIGARSSQVNQVDDDGFSGSSGILGGSAFGDGIGGAGDSVLGIRQANWWIESKQLGRLTVGRMNAATQSSGTIDLSNAGVIIASEPGEFQGGFFMRNGLGRLSATATWNTMCGGPPAAGPYENDCAEYATQRRDAVRYDAPVFHGFGLGGTYGEDHFWDAAGTYAGEWHGFRVAAGLGYRWYLDREPDVPFPAELPTRRLSDTDRRHWLSSASVMHMASGLYVSAAYTRYEFRGTNANEVIGGLVANGHRPDIPHWWVSGGIQRNWTGWGNTTFYGEYGWYDHGTDGLFAATAYPGLGSLAGGAFAPGSLVVDSKVQWWGLGAVQTIDAVALSLYIAYRNYSADATISDGPGNQIAGGLQDIWFVVAGARIQF